MIKPSLVLDSRDLSISEESQTCLYSLRVKRIQTQKMVGGDVVALRLVASPGQSTNQ